MKKENVTENYKSIGKFANLLTEAEKIFDKLPVDIQQKISNDYNDPESIQRCIQRGILIANKIRNDYHIVVDECTEENNREVSDQEKISMYFSNPLLLDRLHILAVEYSVPAAQLIEVAVKRLVDDVDLLRNLRTGKIEMK